MDFHYRINPDIEIPIYVQLVDMLSADIRSGRLPYGAKLPTVRELSDLCEIARGTVIRAYGDLERKALIEKIQGRGTFVCYRETDSASRKDLAMEAIDRMFDTLEALHFSQSEINIYLNLKLQERANDRRSVQIAIVECNNEILTEAAAQLRGLGDVSVYAYHLDDIRAYPYKLTEDLDLVVVSAKHAEELYHYLPENGKIAKAALCLVPASVSGIVRIPEGSRIGILCQSKRYGALLSSVCREYRSEATVAEPETFGDDPERYLSDKDALLVPRDFRSFCDDDTAAKILRFGRKHPVIACEYRIDEGSMIGIGDRIAGIREKKGGTDGTK